MAKYVDSGSYNHRAPIEAQKLPAKELDHLRLIPTENEGHVIEHHFTHGMHEPERHSFGPSEGAEVMAHLAEHGNVKVKNEKPMQDEKGEAEGGY